MIPTFRPSRFVPIATLAILACVFAPGLVSLRAQDGQGANVQSPQTQEKAAAITKTAKKKLKAKKAPRVKKISPAAKTPAAGQTAAAAAAQNSRPSPPPSKHQNLVEPDEETGTVPSTTKDPAEEQREEQYVAQQCPDFSVAVGWHNAPKNAGQCGTERWTVKTLSDSSMNSLKFDPNVFVASTIHELAGPNSAAEHSAFPPYNKDYSDKNPQSGINAQYTNAPDVRCRSGNFDESQAYRVTGCVLGYKMEADHDYHVVIADPDPAYPKTTMIVEIPDPDCPVNNARDNNDAPWFPKLPYYDLLKSVRDQFDQDFGKPQAPAPGASQGLYPLPTPVMAEITGVRFFDVIHGQDGVSLTNGVELHPVLKATKLPDSNGVCAQMHWPL